jgi:hypothetical protein
VGADVAIHEVEDWGFDAEKSVPPRLRPQVSEVKVEPRSSRLTSWWLTFALLGAFVTFEALTWALEASGVRVVDLFKEPAEVGRFASSAPHKGSLATLLNLVWGFGAGATMLAGLLGRRQRPPERRARFLLATGLLLIAFGIDDSLMLHDHVAERIVDSRVAEASVLIALLTAAILWAASYREEIAKSNTRILGVAAPALMLAFLIDQREWFGIAFAQAAVVEETTEFFGIVMFCAYAWLASLSYLNDRRVLVVEQNIRPVRVGIDGETYAMEAARGASNRAASG